MSESRNDSEADHRDLLARVIASSGLSVRQWAKQVVLREERTVRRWIAGDSPIPQVVVEFLKVTASRHP